MEESREIKKSDIVQITIRDGSIVVRTMGHQNYPIDIWRFDAEELTDNERIFRDNILSMAMSMVADKDKK